MKLKPYYQAVRTFKRDLLVSALARHGNNRTHTARALGLQRTYLMRLLRDLKVTAPLLPAGRPQRKAVR